MSYLGNQLLNGTFLSDYFSGDGSTTTFRLTYLTGNESSLIVSISGVVQAAYTYSLNNGQIIFSAPPPSGTNNVEVRYLGNRVSVNPVLSADLYGIIRLNSSVLTENCTISAGYNASSAGPLTVANNVVVTIANNSTWTIF